MNKLDITKPLLIKHEQQIHYIDLNETATRVINIKIEDIKVRTIISKIYSNKFGYVTCINIYSPVDKDLKLYSNIIISIPYVDKYEELELDKKCSLIIALGEPDINNNSLESKYSLNKDTQEDVYKTVVSEKFDLEKHSDDRYIAEYTMYIKI